MKLLLTLLPFSVLPAAGLQRQHFSYTADSTDCRHVQQDDTISASVITAEYLRHRGRDIIISMKGNPMAEGRDAMAFLKLVPNVRGLRINGKSTYAAIYVNGRKMDLPPDKMAKYLSHLPAENLEYIRIAPGRTIKGGSQEAGGTIFLRLRTGDGGLTNGSAGISAYMYTSGPGAEASVPLTLLHSGEKLSSYTFFNGSWTLQPEFQDTGNTLEGEWQESAATGIERAVLMLDHSMTYTISDKHELGFGANLFYKPLEDEHSIFLGQDYVLDKSAGGQHWEELFANYNFTFGDGMNSLSLKADFMNKGDRREESVTSHGAGNMTGFTGFSMTIAVQSALSVAVTDWMEAYAGLEHQTLKSGYGYPVLQNGISHFRYVESTTGAYADFYFSLFDGRVDLEAGIRYEHSVVHAGGSGPSVENTVGRTYDDWLPAVDITISFRVNITRKNADEYPELYKYLYSVFRDKRISISPAIVKDNGGSNENGKGIFYGNRSFAQYILDLFNRHGIHTPFIRYPGDQLCECAVRDKMAMAFDPEGYAYKCWGKIRDRKYAIGRLTADGILTNVNTRELNRELYGADPLDSPVCTKCAYRPICNGGCPMERIQNEFEGYHNDTCTFYKGRMKDFLAAHIMMKENGFPNR